jgi:hypothetical protein
MDILRRSGAIVDEMLDQGRPPGELTPEAEERVFSVHKDEIRDNGLSLLASTYRPPDVTADESESPLTLLREIEQLDAEIASNLANLRRRLDKQPRDA